MTEMSYQIFKKSKLKGYKKAERKRMRKDISGKP